MSPLVISETLLRHALKKVLQALYSGWFVVVQPCSTFSLRCQMTNFLIFCSRIIVIGEEVFRVRKRQASTGRWGTLAIEWPTVVLWRSRHSSNSFSAWLATNAAPSKQVSRGRMGNVPLHKTVLLLLIKNLFQYSYKWVWGDNPQVEKWRDHSVSGQKATG